MGTPPRDSKEASRGAGIWVGLVCLAIAAGGAASLMLWTLTTEPLALVDAVGRGGARELVTFLVTRALGAALELVRWVW